MLSFIIVLLLKFLFTVLVLCLIEKKNMTVYLLHFVFHIFFLLWVQRAEFVVNMFSTQRLTWLLLSGHLAASVMPAINRKLTVHRQGAYYVAQGRIKKRQLVLPQVTKRSTSQPGLRLLRPQRDFFFPSFHPYKVSFEPGMSTTCYPWVGLGFS